MRGLLKIIWDFIKRIFGFLKDHRDTIIKHAAAAGGVAAAAGAGAGIHAKKVNKKALEMQEDAISAFQKSNDETEAVLGKLGGLQIEIIETFDTFVNTMGKIQQRPEGLKNRLSKVTLPEYKPEELKSLSNDLQMAIFGAGGAVAGLGVGAAAFGLNALALGPGALVGGVVLCVKGVTLSKKAAKNKKEAVRLKKDVERIIAYHSKLRESAEMLYDAIKEVRPLYMSHLYNLQRLVSRKTDYKTFTKDEQLLVRNSILLVSLMHEMCKVELVQKAKNENDMESVNEKEVKRVIESKKTVLPKVKPVPGL